MSGTVVSPHQQLLDEATTTLGHWRGSTRLYGTLYPLIRISLIVASALVAARETLAGSPFDWLAASIPLLAVGVTIVTALDTWMKPQVRWQGFMKSRDDLDDLVLEMRMVGDPTDRPAIEGFRRRFHEIRAQHRHDSVF